MKRTILLTILLAAVPCSAAIITVEPDGSGDEPTIQDAIDIAGTGDEIVLAIGTYFGDGNRDIDFGGKAITVRSIDPDDPCVVAETIIDCEGTELDPHRGFKFVSGEDANSILDGLTITGGYTTYVAGGIGCFGSGPKISNCVVRGNRVYGDNDYQSPVSYSHRALGGGIYCSGENAAVIVNCIIADNEIFVEPDIALMNDFGLGGGIYCSSEGTIVKNCTIRNNKISGETSGWTGMSLGDEDGGGGGIYCRVPAIIENCIISGNYSSGVGGGLYFECDGAVIQGCTITDNEAESSGGGIYCFYESTIDNCSINGNLAGKGGGGVYCRPNSSIAIPLSGIETKFTKITHCDIVGNQAKESGGGVCYVSGFILGIPFPDEITKHPQITHCNISGNKTGGVGGGLYSRGGMRISSCTITGNAGYSGGGVYCYGSTVFGNCSIIRNRANYEGGGAYISTSPNFPPENELEDSELTNCIFFDNSANAGEQITLSAYGFGFIDIFTGEFIQIHPPANLIMSYNNIESGHAGVHIKAEDALIWKEGNFDAEPFFVDNGSWDPNGTVDDPNDDFWNEGDYHLLPDSPCIDTGDPNYILDPNYPTDLDGNPRIVNDIIDMGAYEFVPNIAPLEADLYITPRVINRNSRGRFVMAIITLPEGIGKDDIDVDEVFTLFPGGIAAERQFVRKVGHRKGKGQVKVFALFSRSDLMDAVAANGRVELTVASRLKSGQCVYGADSVRIIKPRRQRGRRRNLHRR